jgi:hypothetical protein
MQAWRRDSEAPLANSLIVRGLLPPSGREITDPAHWASVRSQVEQAADALDLSADKSPTPEAASAAGGSAMALRALASALESERLLLEGSREMTPAQAYEVGQSQSERRAELDAALARLESQVHPVQEVPG